MTFATEIAKRVSRYAVQVTARDGVTVKATWSTECIPGAIIYQPRILSCSPITYQPGTSDLAIPTCTLSLINTDGVIRALGMADTWTFTITLNVNGQTRDIGIFVLERPPEYAEGRATLSLKHTAADAIGEILIPTLTDDLATWYHGEKITGVVLPLYLGNFEDPASGAIEAIQNLPNSSQDWYFCTTSDDDPDADLVAANVDVFAEYNTTPKTYSFVTTDQYSLLSRAFAFGGINWRVWYISFTNAITGVGTAIAIGQVNITSVRLNLRAPIPATETLWTPALVIRRLLHYCTVFGVASYATYVDDSMLTICASRLTSAGVESRIKIGKQTTSKQLIVDATANSGMQCWFGLSGKVESFYFSNDNLASVLAGYSTCPARVDTLHMLPPVGLVSYTLENSATVLTLDGVQQPVASGAAGRSTVRDVTINNLSAAGARAAMQRYNDARSSAVETAHRWRIHYPLLAAADNVGDIHLITEHWSGAIAQPSVIDGQTFIPDSATIEETLVDLGPYTDVNAYVLFDESTMLEHILVGKDLTITVSSSSGLIYVHGGLVGDSSDINTGDTIEFTSDANQYSAHILDAPAWNSGTGRWEFTVDSNADATEDVLYSYYKIRVSYVNTTPLVKLSSGFLAASYETFSNGDHGKVGIA
jgi:hypothetical protein